MLYDPNIHIGGQFSLTFFFKRKLVKGRAYAPTPPNFLGGEGGKKCTGGFQRLILVDFVSNKCIFRLRLAVTAFFGIPLDSPLNENFFLQMLASQLMSNN